MLKWTKPIVTKSGVVASNAYWHLYLMHIDDQQKKAILKYYVYFNEASFNDPTLRPFSHRDVGLPKSIELVDGVEYVINSTTYNDVFTNYIIPGLGSQNLLNMLKIFIADKLGDTDLVWDE